MKLHLLPFILFVTFALMSCSSNKSEGEDISEETAGMEILEDDEFIDDLVLEGDEGLIEDVALESSDLIDEEGMEPLMDAPGDSAMLGSTESMDMGMEVSDAGMEKTYTVQKNETLMLIAFKIYGDYEKWRELASYNSGVLNGGTTITEGMQLRYMSNGQDFQWNPEGSPYLIKRGDTLGIISNSVYGTNTKWRSIWNNNKPLIKDPNVIFAGFTIYYLDDGREVANY